MSVQKLNKRSRMSGFQESGGEQSPPLFVFVFYLNAGAWVSLVARTMGILLQFAMGCAIIDTHYRHLPSACIFAADDLIFLSHKLRLGGTLLCLKWRKH